MININHAFMYNIMEYAIEVLDLYKSYGKVRALNGLTLRIKPGEIYGLIGPNGAGKTTTLKILAGLLKPDNGYARIYGYDVWMDRVEALKLIGYVPENPTAFQNLRVEEFIKFIASLRGMDQDDIKDELNYYLNIFNLSDKKRKLINELSRGMLQKTLVIAAFVVRPKILIMDEPMAGMDPESQHVFKEEVKRLVSNGVTALISSHILEVVERFCTRIGIINEGRLVTEGDIDEIKEDFSRSKDTTLEDLFLRIIKGNLDE